MDDILGAPFKMNLFFGGAEGGYLDIDFWN